MLHIDCVEALKVLALFSVHANDNIRTSTADARRRIVASAHGRPITCKPIGSPSLS